MVGKKPGLDLIVALGGGKKSPPGADEGPSDSSDSEPTDLPADFVASFRDYQKDPSPETFWEAVKACTESYDKVASDERLKENKDTSLTQADNFVSRTAKYSKD
jgi:hypothetical protein